MPKCPTLRYKAYGLRANKTPAMVALVADTPILRKHHVADQPPSTIIIIHATLIAVIAWLINRLTTQTIAWSTLVFDGNASSSKPNGAPSIELNHHHPLS